MSQKKQSFRILFILGIVALIIGAVDPLEGSVLILAGSALITVSEYMLKSSRWKWFLYAFLAIAVGIFFLFYLSSLGGFGGKSTLSWWWGLLILPYPIGWLIIIGLLIAGIFRKKTTPLIDTKTEQA